MEVVGCGVGFLRSAAAALDEGYCWARTVAAALSERWHRPLPWRCIRPSSLVALLPRPLSV